jgi:hypothetical protein
VAVAGIQWDASSAHSASYDAERTADVFCFVCNRMQTTYAAAQDRAGQLGWFDTTSGEPAATDTLP